MKAVVQRVSEASVSVEGRVVARIGRGLVALVGIERGDGPEQCDWLASKLAHLRIFHDDEGRMNRSVREAEGAVLLVPNFTVAGDARKGRRPSFDRAMPPDDAAPLFYDLARRVAETGAPVQTGIFQAHMALALINDGPVTIWLEAPEPQPRSA